jgi:DNA-directed RNA polymerase specialized sigma24 family protein
MHKKHAWSSARTGVLFAQAEVAGRGDWRQAVPTDGVDEVARIAWARALVQSGRLQQLRQTGGLSLAEIGRACGVNASTVHRWLRHEAMPREVAALALYELAATLNEALKEFL